MAQPTQPDPIGSTLTVELLVALSTVRHVARALPIERLSKDQVLTVMKALCELGREAEILSAVLTPLVQ